MTLVAGRDDVPLAGVVDDLARADADALVATLNAHFAADGIVFVAPRPDALVRRALAARPGVTTHAARAGAGRAAALAAAATARDASTWRRWQSEIQMLLHEHPVNVARERTAARR